MVVELYIIKGTRRSKIVYDVMIGSSDSTDAAAAAFCMSLAFSKAICVWTYMYECFGRWKLRMELAKKQMHHAGRVSLKELFWSTLFHSTKTPSAGLTLLGSLGNGVYS